MTALDNVPINDTIVDSKKILWVWQKWFIQLKSKIDGLLYKSSCRVHNNSVSKALTANTDTKLDWAVAEQDTQDEVNLDNEAWVAKKDGDYFCGIHAAVEVTADQDKFDLWIEKNTVLIRYKRFVAGSTSDMDLSIITKLNGIVKGDDIRFFINSKDNNDTVNGDPTRTYFEIYNRLGA